MVNESRVLMALGVCARADEDGCIRVLAPRLCGTPWLRATQNTVVAAGNAHVSLAEYAQLARVP